MMKTTPAGLPLIASLSNFELTPRLTWVEVNSFFQIPGLSIIGLPSQEILEAKERIRSAIETQGFELPKRRIIIHLSPAHIPKYGSGYDLPMALAVLAAHQDGVTPTYPIFAWGELGLDGQVRESSHPLRAIYAAIQASIPCVILAKSSEHAARQALTTLAQSLGEPLPAVYCVSNLREAQLILEGNPPPELAIQPDFGDQNDRDGLKEGLTQNTHSLLPPSPLLQKALELAAGGDHHLLLLGPKGTGKTYAFNWLEQIVPAQAPHTRLNHQIAHELVSHTSSPSKGHSSSQNAGRFSGCALYPGKTVFRAVSTQTRPSALLGSLRSGGIIPGEFTLADQGWLVADEFLEWARDTRECLRGPMESGTVLITRAGRSGVELPARFCLAASANACACGGYPPHTIAPHHSLRCTCTEIDRKNYYAKLSGPILDRIDLMVRTWQATPAEGTAVQSLAESQGAVLALRERAQLRLGALPGRLTASELEHFFSSELKNWAPHLPGTEMSLRGRHKTMRIILSLLCHPGTGDSGRDLAWVKPSRAIVMEARSFRAEGGV